MIFQLFIYLFVVHNGHITTFYMDKTSGKIYLAQILDFESIPQYKIIVLATDGGGQMVGE